MRLLTIFSGVLLVLTGLWCIANQGVSFAGLAFVLGLVMVLRGVIGVGAFATSKKEAYGMGWNLSEAVLSVVLGAVVLANQLATDLMIVMFFGMWILVAGCNRMVAGLIFNKMQRPHWKWCLGLGIVSFVFGIYAFLNPILLNIAVGILLGVIFMAQGANALADGIFMPHKKHNHVSLTKKKEGNK